MGVMRNINGSVSGKYTGVVTVSVLSHGKVQKKVVTHNRGTDLLFLSIAEALLGTDITNKIPRYLTVYRSSGEPGASITKASNNLYIQNRYIDGTAAVFECTIPASDIEVTQDESTISVLKIYNAPEDTSDNLLAEVSLSTGISMSGIAPGQSLVVQWKMVFSNS